MHKYLPSRCAHNRYLCWFDAQPARVDLTSRAGPGQLRLRTGRRQSSRNIPPEFKVATALPSKAAGVHELACPVSMHAALMNVTGTYHSLPLPLPLPLTCLTCSRGVHYRRAILSPLSLNHLSYNRSSLALHRALTLLSLGHPVSPTTTWTTLTTPAHLSTLAPSLEPRLSHPLCLPFPHCNRTASASASSLGPRTSHRERPPPTHRTHGQNLCRQGSRGAMATSPTTTPTQPARGAPRVDFVTDEDLEKDWKPNGRRPQS